MSQLVPLEDSPLAGAARNIPDKPFELDPDWEVDPESLEIMEKIGASQMQFSVIIAQSVMPVKHGTEGRVVEPSC